MLFSLLLLGGACSNLAVARTSTRLRGGALGAPLSVVSPDGALSASAAERLLASDASGMVGSVGHSPHGRKLLNALFGTSFSTALSASSTSEFGAWIAAAQSQPDLLILDTEVGGSMEGSALAAFAMTMSGTLVVHAPCRAPSATALQDLFERLFSRFAAIYNTDAPAQKVRLLYLHAANSATPAADVEAACTAAWSRAAAGTPAAAAQFSDVFALESLDSARAEDALRSEFAAKGTRSDASASDAWASACAPVLQPLAGHAPWHSYFSARAFDGAYGEGRAQLSKLGAQVAASRIVERFGPSADGTLTEALQRYDAGVVDVADANEQLAKRRARLQKALGADASELFQKQLRLLTLSILDRYKAQLRKIMARVGTVEGWQFDNLQRVMVKSFDAGAAALVASSPSGLPTRAQLVEAFSKQLTDVGSKYVDSAPMQLQALGATKRRTAAMGKSPRGIRTGVQLVGAARPKWGGGQGNFQSFVGYVAGLNSVHFMFANDGAMADSTGSEPSELRFQPKLAFDISI